ncbi:MAG TPA: autotransporter-associated beta strand repeat-containing protein [bacterium]|nr:autotransporter-associated beta strand repeat-containing protein [bacterium]
MVVNVEDTIAVDGGTLTVSGAISGNGSLVKTGAGTFVLTGSNAYLGGTTVDEGRLVVDGSVTGDLLVNGDGSLGGSGSVGEILGSGMVEPGNSPGILTADQVDPSDGLDFSFELTALAPDYASPAGSDNDVLRITDLTAPFTSALDGDNEVNVYFAAALIGDGAAIEGAFFTDLDSPFYDSIKSADYNYYVSDPTGAIVYNGTNYAELAGYAMSLATVPEETAWGGGYVAQFTLEQQGGGDVPEPSTLLLLLPLAGFGLRRILGKKSCLLIVFAAMLLLAPCVASAASTWDGGGTDVYWQNRYNWSGDVKPASGGDLVFTGDQTNTSNNYAADTPFGTITFNNGDFILVDNRVSLQTGINNLSGDNTVALPLLIAGDRQVAVAAGSSLTVSGAVSGAGGIIKTGGGTLALSGSHTYSGETAINQGIVKLGANNSWSMSNSRVNIASGAVLDVSAYSGTIGGLKGSGNVVVGSELTNDAPAGHEKFYGTISGDGSFTKAGPGIMCLYGTAAYAGDTNISGGLLKLWGTDRINDAGRVDITGGTLDLNNYNETIGMLTGSGAVMLRDGDLTVKNWGSFDGVISGRGSLTVGDGITPASVSLGNANTYSGATVIRSGASLETVGSERLSDVTAMQIDAGGTFVLPVSGTLEQGHKETIGSLSGSGDVLFYGAIGYGRTLAVGRNNRSTTFAGNITGGGSPYGAAHLIKEGTGTLTLTGPIWISGQTYVNQGTLKMGSAECISGADLIVRKGAVLDINDLSMLCGSLRGDGTVDLGTGSLTIYEGAFRGSVIGTGDLSWGAYQEMLLTGSERIGDQISVNLLGGGFDAGSFWLNGFNETIGSLEGIGGVVLGGGTLKTGGNNKSTTFSGPISGAGGLVKQGTGEMVLTGSVTYTGPMTVAGGTLLIDAPPSCQPFAGRVNVSAGALFKTADDGVGSISGAGDIELAGGGYGLIAGSDGTSTTFSGVIKGDGPFEKYGAGVLTLSGANTYTGETGVRQGVLRLGASERISDLSSVEIGVAVFDLNGFDETVAGLSGSGMVKLGSGTLTIAPGAYATTYGGGISGSGGITKSGTGTLTIVNGEYTYTGATTVSAGTLLIGHANVLPDASGVSVASGAVLAADYSDTIRSLSGSGKVIVGTSSYATLFVGAYDADSSFDGVISGAYGGLGKIGTGTLSLMKNNTYADATIVFGGSLVLSGTAGALSATSSVSANNGGALVLDNTVNNSGNRIYNSATLFMNGGSVNFAGNPTLAGTETVGEICVTTGSSVVEVSHGELVGATLTSAALGRYEGAVIDFRGAGLGQGGANSRVMFTAAPDVVSTNGIIPFATANGSDFASYGSYGIKPYASYAASFTGASAASNVRLANSENLSADKEVYTLNLDNKTVGGAYTLTLGGGALINNGASALNVPALALGAEGIFFVNGPLAVNSVIDGPSGFIKAGTGTLTLNKANAYLGTTYVYDGTFKYGINDVIAGNDVAVNGGVLDLGGYTDSVGTVTLTHGTITGSQSLTAGTSFVVNDGTVDVVLAGAASLEKASAETDWTVTLTKQNTYTGPTVVTTGTLKYGVDNAISDASDITVDGVLDLGAHSDTMRTLGGSGKVALAGGTLAVGLNNASSDFWGDLSGYGQLTKIGTGTFGILGIDNYDCNSDYAGNVTVSAGTLALGLGYVSYNHTLGEGATVTVNAGAALSLYEERISGISGAGNILLDGGVLSVGCTNSSSVFPGTMGGSGLLVKEGTGTLTMSKPGGLDWDIDIQGGTFRVTASNVAADDTIVTVGEGALYNLNGYSDTIATLNGAGNVSLGTGDLFVADTVNLTGAVQGTGGFGFNAMTYASSDRIGDLVAVTVAGTLDLRSFSDTIGSLASLNENSTVAMNGTLTVGGNNQSTTYAGAISGLGSLVKNGTGTMTLSGYNAYEGPTMINAGTLKMGIESCIYLYSGDVNVASGAVYDLAGFNQSISSLTGNGGVKLGAGDLTINNAREYFESSTFGGTISGTGDVYLNGGKEWKWALSGRNTYTGNTYVQSGTLAVNGSLASPLVDVEGGAMIAGSGDILGDLLLESGASVSPGSSPGILETGDMTWSEDGHYIWEINDADGVAGSAWDLIDVTGRLTINANAAEPFIIDLATLTSSNQPGEMADFDYYEDDVWTIVTTTLGITGFSSDKFSVNTQDFYNYYGSGSFSVAKEGNNLNLVFTPGPCERDLIDPDPDEPLPSEDVPEPSTLLLLLPLIGFGIWRMKNAKNG